MIINFEDYTHELTDKEKKAVPRIIGGLLRCKGKDNAITNGKMADKLYSEGYGKISGPRMRKILHFIRSEQIVKNVIASSKGYYIATSKEEIEVYKQSLRERISANQKLLDSFD